MIITLLTIGCPKPPDPPVPPPIYSCSADSHWVTTPQPPMEIAQTESFCDFYQFSWQWFLAQTSPAASFPDERVFETQRVFSKTFGANQCAQQPQMGRQAALSVSTPRFLKPEDFEDIQADAHALYDQNGNILLYNIWYSEASCGATDKGFQEGTMELKVSWKVLDHLDPDYFSVSTLDTETQQPIYLGMVGFHMAIFTKNHPEMIWVTWEHKENAPNCNGSEIEDQDWNFASKDAAKCLKEHGDCSVYAFNTPEKFEGAPPHHSKPNEVCRLYPYGNLDTPAVNGNDNKANLQAILDLNEQLVGEKGILTNLPKEDPMHVWSNYEMVGGLWTKDGADSGKPPVDSKQGPADPNSPQRGSLELTNMSMETFQQGRESVVPNCFGCHHYTSEDPLKVSHIQQYLTPKPEPEPIPEVQ